MSHHNCAVFNNSCLKVPLNPSNRFPSPSYERKLESSNIKLDNKTNKQQLQRNIQFNGTSLRPRPQSWSPSAGISKKSITKFVRVKDSEMSPRSSENGGNTKEYFSSLLNFYESIPDYGDVNHLSDTEFYSKLQGLKERRMLYAKTADAYGDVVNAASSKLSEDKDISSNLSVNDINPNIKRNKGKYKHKHRPNYVNVKGYEGTNWEKFSYKNESQTASETGSATPCYIVESPAVHSDNTELVNFNNFAKDFDNSQMKKEFPEQNVTKKNSFSSELETYNIKNKKRNSITNKRRDIHSAPLVKPGNFVTESSNSIVESFCDGLSLEDFCTKSEYSSDSNSIFDDILLACSLPSSPVMKMNKNVMWREPKITVPKPFNMTVREEEDKRLKSIKCALYSEQESEEDYKSFKANPVPINTQLPLYEKLMEQQDRRFGPWNRRKRIHEECIANIKSQMRPFSFLKREEEMKKFNLYHSTPELRIMESNPKPFRAKPVPKNLFGSHVYQKMREDEFYRSLKRKIRAEELLRSSSLPPSMAAREQLAKDLEHLKNLSKQILEPQKSEKNSKRKHYKIPDYKRSHDKIMRELEARFYENITTSPMEFSFKTSDLSGRKSKTNTSASDILSNSPYPENSSISKEKKRPRSALSITVNRNNLAAILRIQSARQRLEHEIALKQEEIQKREEARLKQRLARRKPAWKSLNYSVTEDLELRIQSRREEERIRREEFLQDMEMMLDRVEQIPTLFERQSYFMQKKSNLRKYSARRKGPRMSGLSVSVQNIPHVFSERELSPSMFSEDKSSKSCLKVSINENAQTIECESDYEDESDCQIREKGVKIEEIVEDKNTEVNNEENNINSENENNLQQHRGQSESEYSESFQEDLNDDRSLEIGQDSV